MNDIVDPKDEGIVCVRCSSLDDVNNCPPSVLATGPEFLRISPTNDAASMGRASHTCLGNVILTDSYDAAEALASCGLAEEKSEELNRLVGYGGYIWRKEIGRFFKNAQVEAHSEGPVIESGGKKYRITGTLDTCSDAGVNKAIFLDWKTGYIDDGYYQQMTGYAYLLWNHMDRRDECEITGIVAFLRHGYYRVIKYTSAKLLEWETNLTKNVLSQPDKFQPSKSCKFCGMSATCQARQAVVAGCITEIIGGVDKAGDPGWLDRGSGVLKQMTEENKDQPIVGEILSDMCFRIRLCRQAIDAAKAMIRDTIERVGPISIGADMHLALREIEIPKLDPLRAMPVLRRMLSDTQIAEALRVSYPAIVQIYANNHRTEGETVRASKEIIRKQLTDAGAVTVSIQKRVEEVLLDPETLKQETEDGNDNSERTPEEP